jgi:RHS repeat-associated protein
MGCKKLSYYEGQGLAKNHFFSGVSSEKRATELFFGLDYYPFGSVMPNSQNLNASSYGYGFNGEKLDNEVSGNGNMYDYGFRIYNPRLGKFLSEDPLTSSYPMLTPYQFASNTPIQAIDLDGLEAFYIHGTWATAKTWVALEKENFATINNATGNNTHFKLTWRNGIENPGPNSSFARRQAAEQLAQTIIDNQVSGEPLTIIGHSHGGNVAIMVTNILAKKGIMVDFLITINTPVLSKYQLNKGTQTLHYNIYHKGDPVQASGGDEYILPKITFKKGKIDLDFEKGKSGEGKLTGEVGKAGRIFESATNNLELPFTLDYHNTHNKPEQWGLWLTKNILFDTALKGVSTGFKLNLKVTLKTSTIKSTPRFPSNMGTPFKPN